jgi:hypothetical protein
MFQDKLLRIVFELMFFTAVISVEGSVLAAGLSSHANTDILIGIVVGTLLSVYMLVAGWVRLIGEVEKLRRHTDA